MKSSGTSTSCCQNKKHKPLNIIDLLMVTLASANTTKAIQVTWLTLPEEFTVEQQFCIQQMESELEKHKDNHAKIHLVKCFWV